MSGRISSIITAFVLAALMALSPITISYAGGAARPEFAGSPFDVVNAVNALRASHGLAPYSINSILMYTAQSQADFLAATGTMTHTGPGGSGLTDRLLAAGYPLAGELSAGGFRAENITGGNESMPAQSAVDQWTGDALHLNTMLSPNLTEIGAGVAVSGGRVYYVIDCARPTTSGAPEASTSVAESGSAVPAREAPILVAIVSTPNSNGDVIHEVQFGQTLWQLAIAYNVKIDEIKSLNNLSDNGIYPGNKLLIKTGVIQPTAAHTETPTRDLTVTSINTPISAASILQRTSTSTRVVTPLPSSPPRNKNAIMGVMMGIIALALLGGGLFTWLGSSKK
ncbi:MAG: CAP domain-containing protein [Anaerolineales bacterium]